MSTKLRFLNAEARAHWAWAKGAHKELVLVFGLPGLPEGALCTQEGAAVARRALGRRGGQFLLMDPAMAALAGFSEVLGSAEVRELLGQGPDDAA